MTYGALKQVAFDANMELASSGLVMGTFGNLSAIDRAAGVFAIKPSGVPYDALTPGPSPHTPTAAPQRIGPDPQGVFQLQHLDRRVAGVGHAHVHA